MNDIFISHAWRYHDEWSQFCDFLDSFEGFKWRNFSLPWYDPAYTPNSPKGGEYIRKSLELQIVPAHTVVILEGVYKISSAREWVDFEIAVAKKLGKKIIGLPCRDEAARSEDFRSQFEHLADWNEKQFLETLN